VRHPDQLSRSQVDQYELPELRRLAIEGVLADAAGTAYDPETGARQAAALMRFIGRRFVSATVVADMVSNAREHELMLVLDFMSSIPPWRVTDDIEMVTAFVGRRASHVVGSRRGEP
jgi:hypothetical protein